MKKISPSNGVATTIVQPESHTAKEMFGNWEVALKNNSKDVQRGKKYFRILIVSFVLDVLFTVAIGYGAVHLHTVTQQAAIATCESGNVARANNRQLWDYVISLNGDVKPSQALLRFETYLDKATAPRDCSGIQ